MLQLDNITRKAGTFKLHIDHLLIGRGSYLVLLGPSGSGKTMLLELIAGLEQCESGHIWMNGIDITHMPAGERGVGVVFQKQWLFPHLTVAENIAYGLRSKRMSKSEIRDSVTKLAIQTQCEHLLHRKADKLSGGEAQRVALARTLALKPEILLLDEPLANLDTPLRTGIASLIRQLHRDGQTIIHVTHDYSEAIALATAVAVMQQGSIVQHGSLQEVLSRPRNAFVAGFTGIRNFFHGHLMAEPEGDEALMTFRTETLFIKLHRPDAIAKTGFVNIDAHAITLATGAVNSSAVNQFSGIVADLFETPDGIEVVVDVAGTMFYVLITRQSVQRLHIQQGTNVFIQFKASAVRFEPD
ncbi:MAG TPA: ABC transporter ATP-binding protein [Bacteroidales bacterium]|nr:ABC transporter ATP-binding protein [Bacteroidales bacterium]